MLRTVSTLSVLLVLAACGAKEAAPTDAAPAAPQPHVLPELADTGDPVADMRAWIEKFRAIPEVADAKVDVQHVLIAFAGAQRAEVKRSKEDAEKLAAEVFRRARNGEDFKSLMQTYSSDKGSFNPPGYYTLDKANPGGWVAGFTQVGFRLAVGEVGVAPYDATDSPFGWHILKRVK